MNNFRTNYLCLLVAFTWLPTSAFASFIGDAIDATVTSVFSTAISGSAIVGAGTEFTGTSLIYTYDLDISANSFTLTVSKPYSSGNFTGVLTSLVLGNIDYAINSVVLDTAASSAYSGTMALNLAVPGQIEITAANTFISLNTPASALSHSLTWDVTFGDRIGKIPEPGTILLLALGLLALASRKQKST